MEIGEIQRERLGLGRPMRVADAGAPLFQSLNEEGKRLPCIPTELEDQILAALRAPGRTEGVRKIAKRFGVNAATVQRISRPFDGAGAAA